MPSIGNKHAQLMAQTGDSNGLPVRSVYFEFFRMADGRALRVP